MAINNKSDETFSILTNYSYKQHISDYSVEAVTHSLTLACLLAESVALLSIFFINTPPNRVL